MKIKNLKLKINNAMLFSAIISLFFTFVAFYNLAWGSPFYFHPDERNIASSVSQLNLFSNLNPHFLAYGQLPIYLTYFLGILLNLLTKFELNFTVPFEQAIILGRVISAILTLSTLALTYKFTNKLAGKNAAIFSIFLSATSVAYLQYSHFGTFEIWLAFFSLLTIYLFFLFIKTNKVIYFILGSAFIGIASALKLSSAVLILVPAFMIISEIFKKEKKYLKIKKSFKLFIFLIYFSSIAYFLSSPFNLLDNSSFLSSMKYEGQVAIGFLPVFYTGSFYGTAPIIFQFEKILPFLINPLMTLLFIPAIFYAFYIFLKKKNFKIGIALLSFLVLFVSSSFLFTKWTRYIIPSLSFLYMIIAVFIFEIKKVIPRTLFRVLLSMIIIGSVIYAFSFVKTVRLSSDTRITARDFAIKNIPPKSYILSEVYDMGIVPFNERFPNIKLFNFYDLDNGNSKNGELKFLLEQADYIVLPSQRILKSRIINKKKFPNGNKFYSDLFSNTTEFKKIYETPCDLFCNIVYMGDPVFNVEETSNVFDRPTVLIFKKN